MAAAALPKIRDLVRDQLEQKARKGHKIYWNNFASAWQKLTAGRGRAKKLGQGFSDKLVSVEAEEAVDLLIEKAGAIYGLMIVGQTSEGSDADTSTDDERLPPARSSPMGHDGSDGHLRPTARSSPMGHDGSDAQPPPSPLGHGGADVDTMGDAGAKGKGPAKGRSGKGSWQLSPRSDERKGARVGPLPWEKEHPANLRRTEIEGRRQLNARGKGQEDKNEGGTWAQRLKGKPAQKAQRQGKGPVASSAQPAWEKLCLMQEEWDVDVITQEELVDGDGIALVSKQFFYDNYEALSNTWSKAAAIIPPGIEWFADKPRTRQLCELLRRHHEVHFAFTYDEDGKRMHRTKRGLLLQLSKDEGEVVRQCTEVLEDFLTPQKQEISLEFMRDLMPAKKWDEASRNPRDFFEDALMNVTGCKGDDFNVGYITNKGEAFAVIVKVPEEALTEVLTNIDRSYIFARRTVRGEEKDDLHVPLWLPQRKSADLLMHVRDAREHARRQAGSFYRGIAVRYRQGYQIGIRVKAEHAPALRERILPKKLQPAEEAKGVHGRAYYRVMGLPADLDKKTCSTELHRVLRWPTIPMREWVKPGSPTADWIVAADDPPPRRLFHIRLLGSEIFFPVVIEEDIPRGTKDRVFTPNINSRGKGTEQRPSGPKYFHPSCWAEDDVDERSDLEMDCEQDEEGPGRDGDLGPNEAYGRAAAAVAAGRTKGSRSKGKEGYVDRWSQPATPCSPTVLAGGGAGEQEEGWSEGPAGLDGHEAQSHFIGESDPGGPMTMQAMMQAMQSLMQKIENESNDRQLQIYHMQQEQLARSERAEAFEKTMLGFKEETEKRFRDENDRRAPHARGRKGPRASSSSGESRGRDRGRSRTEDRRRARRRTVTSDKEDDQY